MGWRQPTLSGYDILTGNNLISKSGRYFDDFHTAVSIKNIKDTHEDADISNANFNAYLESLQKAAIVRILQGVFNKDIIIENLQLFSRREPKEVTLIENENKFCGFKINVANDSSYAVRLNSLSLLFDGDKTFNMYCFHSFKGKIWEKSVTVSAGVETVFNIDDLLLSISSSTYKAGDFFIGYFQEDLGDVRAIDYDVCEWACPSIFGYRGFKADQTGPLTYDVDSVVYNDLNYGINMELTSVRDFTQVIIRNPSMFDEAIGLQVTCNVIENIIYSIRSNSTERINKEQLGSLYTELNQDMPTDTVPYSAGFKNRLKREIQRLNKNFFNDDKVTMYQS
ncbi:MAG TPA: hypothetical protein VGF79_00855 [Bacteroidia bacterium]